MEQINQSRRTFKARLARLGTAGLRLIPPEVAHELGMKLIELGLMDFLASPRDDHWLSGFEVQVPGLGRLKHPIGLAAGFDKNIRCPHGFARMGFAFLEMGTVTPRPQPGNPKPRLFRYPEQMALINRMGFNGIGAKEAAARLSELDWPQDVTPLGVNLGKNKTTPDDQALMDYLDGIQMFRNLARYMVINVSSPNTAGLRALAESEFLALLASEAKPLLGRIFVKLDPDLPKAKFQAIVAQIADAGYQGLILCNTHKIDWPEGGGLSGHPVASLSQSRLEWAYEVHKGQLLMIASGGIFSGLDIVERMARGAHAVQIYTALVYRGPFAVIEMLEELRAELVLRGISKISDIIGSYYKGGL